MKVPIYNAKQKVSAPQLNTPKVADPVDLSQAINFVENRYEQGVKERKQEDKLFFANETARTELELQKKYAEAQQAIEDGDYSALDRYNEFYNQTAKSSVERLSYNPNYAEQAKISYERLGLETGLKLKSAKRQKMKSDSVNYFNNSIELKLDQYSRASSEKERANILGEVSSGYARLESLGAIGKGGGELGVRKFVAGAVVNDLNSINLSNGPIVALNFLEKSRESISESSYIDFKTKLTEQKNKLEKTFGALEAVEGGVATPQQVDEVYTVTAPNNKFNAALDIANKTGKLPKGFEQAALNAINIDFQTATTSDYEEIGLFTETYKLLPQSAKNQLDDTTSLYYEIMSASIDSGLDVASVAKNLSETMSLGKKEFQEDFNSFIANSSNFQGSGSLEDLNDGFFIPGGVNISPIFDFVPFVSGLDKKGNPLPVFEKPLGTNYIPPQAHKEYKNLVYMYSKAGHSLDSARRNSARKVMSNYKEHKGRLVKYAPSLMYPNLDESKFHKANVVSVLKNRGVYEDGVEYFIQADRQTEALVKNRQDPTYRIVKEMTDSFGNKIYEAVTVDGGFLHTSVPKIKTPKTISKKYSEGGFSKLGASLEASYLSLFYEPMSLVTGEPGEDFSRRITGK